MANTEPVRFSITEVDQLGTEASEAFYALVDPEATVAALLSAWAVLAQDVDAVASGQIIRGGITIVPDPAAVLDPPLRNVPSVGSRVEQGVVLNFGLTGSSRRWGQSVPCLDSANISAGKPDLTPATAIPDLANFLITSGIAVLTWVSADHLPIAVLRDALLSFRKKRKQLSRTSFEV
jgi:hypothetical protein